MFSLFCGEKYNAVFVITITKTELESSGAHNIYLVGTIPIICQILGILQHIQAIEELVSYFQGARTVWLSALARGGGALQTPAALHCVFALQKNNGVGGP